MFLCLFYENIKTDPIWVGFAIGSSVTLSGKDRATILITESQPPSTLKCSDVVEHLRSI